MSSTLEVRAFQSADADAVVSLWNDSLPDSQPWNDPINVICRKQNQNDELFLVGTLDDRVAATVIAGYDGIRGWIYSLAVDRSHRRQGIGRRMLAAAENALLDRGCPKVNLQVRSTNAPVVAFYERCGYKVEDRASLGKPLAVADRLFAEPVPTLETDNHVALTPIRPTDKPAYVRLFNANTAFGQLSLLPLPYLEIDAEQWLAKVSLQDVTHGKALNWAIRDADGELIGGVGFHHLELNEMAEVGYWVAESHWGRGIATAATRTLCEHGFSEYGLRRIHARVFATNPASSRVLEKAGFTHEGTLRNHFFRDGECWDVLVYGRLRE